MPSFSLAVESEIVRDAKVLQCEGIFDVPPSKRSRVEWNVDLPIEERQWKIGLIVGPSGCGKSTIARKVFDEKMVNGFDWDEKKAVVSQFGEIPMKEVSSCLSAVGFSSPPSWLRPFHALSNGEQFRVTLARALACCEGVFCIDEFTSVVDRTVAQIGSAAVSKAVRNSSKQMVAVACHYDIIEWLQPDWVYEPVGNKFTWRSLRRRPSIKLEIKRTSSAAWEIFKSHHYLSSEINKAAGVFVAFVNGRPAAMSSALSFPHPTKPGFREHRTVCLPDFQGVGIGNALSEYVASLYSAIKVYRSTTSSPSMIYHRAKSKLWKMTKAPSFGAFHTKKELKKTSSASRRTASFQWVGPSCLGEAQKFGIA